MTWARATEDCLSILTGILMEKYICYIGDERISSKVYSHNFRKKNGILFFVNSTIFMRDGKWIIFKIIYIYADHKLCLQQSISLNLPCKIDMSIKSE